MQPHANLKHFRAALGLTQAQVAEEMGLQRSSYHDLEINPQRVPRQETVARILSAMNSILLARGSVRRVSYDELWSAICAGRGIVPVPHPVAGDLTRIDQPVPAPTAQGD